MPANIAPPAALVQAGQAWLAARPSEIDFVGEGGLRGVVSRKAYLGETVDYRVMIGDAEIRVQKGRRVPGPAVGDSVGLAFPQPHWYPIE
jgi:iron(III) transport system ATP-binding protein